MTKPFNRELAAEVVSLRRAGASFDVISDRLSLSPRSAKALFDKALSTYDADLNLALEADRLDRLHMAVWPRALQGDLDAIDRVLRISERRDKVVSTPKRNDHAFRKAFDESAATSDRLNPEWDHALLEAGRKIADRVDAAIASGDSLEATKTLYLIPHMLNVLREMLATPSARAIAAARAAAAAPEPQPAAIGQLARLRSIHAPGETG